MDINNTLAERGSRYGSFDQHAKITQAIKRAMADSPNWLTLSDPMKEALEMAAHKIGRILNGDPNYDDSWIDIVGYTQLVINALHGKNDSGVVQEGREAVSSPPATQAVEWIEWDGKGPRPVKPELAVEIQCRDGQRFDGKAGGYSWSHIGTPSDIIAYRIIKE